MLSKIIQFVKAHLDDIILVTGVVLVSLLSFLAGYITAKQQQKEPIKIDKYETFENSHCRGRDMRTLSGLEIG
ncbi:MAG: hypothetical protein WC514_00825 [Candidatus Paceibacterota bacterium]